MTTKHLLDKKVIEPFLRKNPYLHIYGLGDLDDFFWPRTTWYGWHTEGELEAVTLLYSGISLPVFLALTEQPDLMRGLLKSTLHHLPARFYSHLSSGVDKFLRKTHRLSPHGVHTKMALKDPAPVNEVDCSQVVPLSRDDLDELVKLYEESYPGNWFEPRMMEIHPYFGIKEGGKIISVAGVHVYSGEYRVAALGNIATLPDHRGKGLGMKVTAKLCQSLLEKVDHIGLNVKTDNDAAVACYKKLGFEDVASYEEFFVERQ